jgi:hypothetical protein
VGKGGSVGMKIQMKGLKKGGKNQIRERRDMKKEKKTVE